MIIIVLVLLGLCFGSFINALVWRLHAQEGKRIRKQELGKKNKTPITQKSYSILNGRSMCLNCKHQLPAIDLIPIISWLSLGSKCRYCKKTISWQYPAVELLTAVIFVVFYLSWPFGFDQTWAYVWFIGWLIAAVGLIALAVYDIKWMLLPDKIISSLGGLTIFFYILQFAFGRPTNDIWDLVFASFIGGSVFWLLYQLSKGKWIGGGDVKLGFLLGLLVAKPELSLLVLFLASVIGLIFTIPLLLSKKVVKSSKLPFGPFLITASFITILYGPQIIDWYKSIFLIA